MIVNLSYVVLNDNTQWFSIGRTHKAFIVLFSFEQEHADIMSI